MGGTRELVADAVPATSRHVARCASCSAALLRCDFHGRSAAHMDVALARHRSGYCVRADAAVADAAFALTSLLDGIEGGGFDVEWNVDSVLNKASLRLPTRVIWVGCVNLRVSKVRVTT